jgi:shikimate kinase
MTPISTRVYLTGFMGAGKSTLGRVLARRLSYDFADLDALVQTHIGRSVASVFRYWGESAFRRIERETLEKTSALERTVIAVGGGALVDEDAMKWARAHGLVVYLDAPTDLIVQRLRRSRTVRPLILDDSGKRLSADALRERVEALLNERLPSYRSADLVFRVVDGSVDENVDRLALHIEGMTS